MKEIKVISSVLIAGDTGPAHGPDEGYPVEHFTRLIMPTLQEADFHLVNWSCHGLVPDT
jgi:hypothetical protein